MKIMQRALLFLAVISVQALLITHANANKEQVIFKTNKGSFTLTLDSVKAPATVENFLRYVDDGFYNNTVFHRSIPGFVVQGGGFDKGLKQKKTHKPIKNESANRLKNSRGSISMARRSHPDTATSQFYINLSDNRSLDYKSKIQPGYTVFGNITQGMDVIDEIASVPTHTVEKFRNVPKEDIIVISAKRKISKTAKAASKTPSKPVPTPHEMERYIAGEHYTVLDEPVSTRNSNKVEVVEMFSYGCPHCYEFGPQLKAWGNQQSNEIDLWSFPAVWNKSMRFYAQAHYTAIKLDVLDKVHMPLFDAVVVKQKKLSTENELAAFFGKYGIDKKRFRETFNSDEIIQQAKQAEQRVRSYKPVGVPEIIVNGKYRIDRMRAGGMSEMLAVADFLVNKERALLKK